jgi:hypothetical protein
MTEYERLLTEVLAKIQTFHSTTAKEYIPKMYLAIRKENPSLTAKDARDRIERDCLDKIWTHRTILDALPDEAKNPTRQEAARSKHKKNFAAMAAANLSVKREKEILIDVTGKPIENKNGINPPSKLTADKIPMENKNDLINVVLLLQADDVFDHIMEYHYLGEHKEPHLWINGSINKETGEVISTSIGCHTIS